MPLFRPYTNAGYTLIRCEDVEIVYTIDWVLVGSGWPYPSYHQEDC